MSDNPTTEDPAVTQLYAIAQDWIKNHEKPGPANLIVFATTLMCAAQRLVRGNGSYKKTVVLTVLARAIDNEVEFASKADEQAVLDLVATMVPPAIDAIVNVGEQLFNPENVVAVCTCLGCKRKK
jgi:hypothetical protein